MFSSKLFKTLSLTWFLTFMLLTLWGCQPLQNFENSQEENSQETEKNKHLYSLKLVDNESPEDPAIDSCLLQKDSTMNLLGKSFAEIKEELGAPKEHGYSNEYGPADYMLFKNKDGAMVFYSPENLENKRAISIVLGEGKSILGTEVGMTFAEIKDILGPPTFGPEPATGNSYFMDYALGETTNDMPEVFISFSADDSSSGTHEVFIKWEAYDFNR